MSTLNITRGITLHQQHGLGAFPLMSDRFSASEIKTTSATSVVSDNPAAGGEIWNLTPVGADVWIAFGPGTPVAVVGSGMLLKDGSTYQFSATAGYKVAAILA
ncbi:hypothetical protein NKJ88_05990 [Mesorhizobium sp. M0016]|uniref:hypothetical protein n=1 Tax=Mesorhizobium sp. M0016 TaxID=2956843 RepID=UPI0033353B44